MAHRFFFFDIPTGDSGGPLVQARPFNISEAYSDRFVLSNLTRSDPATFQRAYALLDLRGGVVHGPWEANVFVTNATNKQAELSKFIPDNYDASTRTRMFTNRPRTAGVSLQWKF